MARPIFPQILLFVRKLGDTFFFFSSKKTSLSGRESPRYERPRDASQFAGQTSRVRSKMPTIVPEYWRDLDVKVRVNRI